MCIRDRRKWSDEGDDEEDPDSKFANNFRNRVKAVRKMQGLNIEEETEVQASALSGEPTVKKIHLTLPASTSLGKRFDFFHKK